MEVSKIFKVCWSSITSHLLLAAVFTELYADNAKHKLQCYGEHSAHAEAVHQKIERLVSVWI